MVAARVRGTELRVVVGAVAPVPTVLTVDADSPGESAAAQVEPWGSVHGSPDVLPAARARPRRSHSRTGAGASSVIAVDVIVNRRRYREEVEPRLLLSDFLRHRLGLTGTHVGCEHGVCGACTVRLDGAAVRSCLLLAAQVDGVRDRHRRGPRGSRRTDPAARGVPSPSRAPVRVLHAGHPHRGGGPARARPPRRRGSEIVDMLSGQLCRCTGYTSIVDAIAEVAGA